MDTIIAKCRKLISIPFSFSILQPQSQINKCNNEKRRREQENEYIEQLGEFIHINKRDMNAPKPDKAAILNEVVKHVSRCGFVFFIGFQFCGLFLYRKLHMRKSSKHFPLQRRHRRRRCRWQMNQYMRTLRGTQSSTSKSN